MSEKFHIPTGWRVLVVEDTEDRISWFRQRLPKAVFAKSAEAAFRALDQQEFRLIFLDHDLHWMHADNSIFKGTGKEVARFLAQKEFQGIVIIHSKHVEGAAAMKKYLSNARLAPFGSFDIVSEAKLCTSVASPSGDSRRSPPANPEFPEPSIRKATRDCTE